MDEIEPKAVGVKNPPSPIDVGGKVMEMILSVEMLQARHRRSLHEMSHA
jgi:hypothetical protein